MPKRKGISKGVRFDVLNRDNFTCRYCGSSPPDVKLVIDHLVAVSIGGANEPENLVTACDRCNAGKSAKIVDEQAIPAITEEAENALLLSIQRQKRMLSMYGDLRRVRHGIYWQLATEWAEAFNAVENTDDDGATHYTDCDVAFPTKNKFLAMFDRYGLEIASEAIRVTAGMFYARRIKEHALERYIWGVCRGIEDRQSGDGEGDDE